MKSTRGLPENIKPVRLSAKQAKGLAVIESIAPAALDAENLNWSSPYFVLAISSSRRISVCRFVDGNDCHFASLLSPMGRAEAHTRKALRLSTRPRGSLPPSGALTH
jgi:hypothetical protein